MKADEFIKGIYIGVRFDDDTKNSIQQYILDNNIKNPIDLDELHTTLIHSEKPCPYYSQFHYYNPPLEGLNPRLEMWDTRDGNKCLVIRFDCSMLSVRHKDLMVQHDATYDFPEYKPHISLSYDAGDIDINTLPSYNGPIKITNEYREDLQR